MTKEVPIVSIDIENEMDIMLCHRRGMQFAKFSGMSLSAQTRFATAISEISRNVVEYAGHGTIRFVVLIEDDLNHLIATITDKGSGIKNLPGILERQAEGYRGRGIGIVVSRKLVDHFSIESSKSGTKVTLKQTIPSKSAINNLIVQGWVKHIESEPIISAYEELKIRNMQLIELTEELNANSRQVDKQIVEITALNEQLERSNKRMKEFTYAISHDLKTPLSSLSLATEYLETNPSGDEVPAYRQILSRSVKRLTNTVRSLIEILDRQGRGKDIIKNLEFENIFNQVQEEHDQFIKEAGPTVDVCFENSPSIAYIEAYLQSIFHNLLSNALKYRHPDRQLKIRVLTDKHPAGVLLAFSDNGIGMDLEQVGERLFGPFNRFSTGQDGKGIGLYLIKGMVESNGGNVSVESIPGEGTTFRFILVPHKS
jgi:signal transduction histidine kinase